MDTEHSASSILPWIWVIEALASMNGVDISVLTDLVVKTPEVADDVGKDARDILSLRLLEDFQVQQVANVIASFTGPTPNIEIGQSTDHEDILQFLLQKISVFSVIKEQSEALNFDLQTSIQNRRSSLPKCTLERLKVAIQEGNPIFESLKESSRLSTSADLATNMASLNGSLTNNEACSNAVPQKVKQRVHSVRAVSIQGNLALSQSTILQDPVKTDHISSRCKGIDPASKDKFPEHLIDILSPKDESDSHLHIAKKAKHAVSVEIKGTDKLLAPMVSNEMSENLVETGSKMTIVSKVKRLRSKEDGHDLSSGKHNFLKEEDNDRPIGPSVCSLRDITEKECVNNAETEDGNDRSIGPSVCSLRDRTEKECVNNAETEDGNDRSIEPSVCSLRDRTEKECINDAETEGDNEGFDDEKIDIEIKRLTFLSSQCTFSEDTTQICMKCNRDGELLVCSTSNCMKGVHPSCLGYAVDCRHFYCQHCSYSNAISEYLEAKKNSSLARESFIAFMRFENESPPTNSKRDDLEGNHQDTSSKQHCSTGKKNRRQKEPLESRLYGNQPSENEHVGPECETEHNWEGEQITKKNDRQQGQSNLCKELVVYAKRENLRSNDDTDKSSESVVSTSNFYIQYRNKPSEM